MYFAAEPSTKWLWFDVEQRYKTMMARSDRFTRSLWFDVEQRYKTICF